MMVERCKSARHNLIRYLKVYDQETHDLMGRVVDVSHRGMMVVGERPYEPESGPRKLRVMLPETIDTPYFDVEAECRWGGPDVNAELFDGGFEFVNMTDDLKDTLDLVVDELSFEHGLDDDPEI